MKNTVIYIFVIFAFMKSILIKTETKKPFFYNYKALNFIFYFFSSNEMFDLISISYILIKLIITPELLPMHIFINP